jgi:hypothetical protein
MSKDEMIEMLKIANCDINTIIFAVNAWEMGQEWQKEQSALLCDEESIRAKHYSAPTQSKWLGNKIRAA